MMWKDGELATRRGSSLPLKVPSNATSEVLKAKAVAKQNRFNSSLIKSDKPLRTEFPVFWEFLGIPRNS